MKSTLSHYSWFKRCHQYAPFVCILLTVSSLLVSQSPCDQWIWHTVLFVYSLFCLPLGAPKPSQQEVQMNQKDCSRNSCIYVPVKLYFWHYLLVWFQIIINLDCQFLILSVLPQYFFHTCIQHLADCILSIYTDIQLYYLTLCTSRTKEYVLIRFVFLAHAILLEEKKKE